MNLVAFVASALLVAPLFGLISSPAAAEQPPCTGASIDTAFQQTQLLHSEMWKEPSDHNPAYFHTQAAALYAIMPACETLEERANLDDTQNTRLGYVFLIGYCDIALSETTATKYQLGRDALTACLNNLDKMHAVAVARKWTKFFEYERRFKPILEQADQVLTAKGFPPDK